MTRVQADQSTQQRFGDLRVGILRVGVKLGVPTARVALRTPDDQQIVELSQGVPVVVPGHGAVTLVDVHRRDEPTGRDAVTLDWEPSADVTGAATDTDDD